MCGIAGIFSPAGAIGHEDVAATARMSEAQIHRGPDSAGVFHDQNVALGHRRLSIIDLSDAGRQPLGNEDATVQVVCNGEIYNYRELKRDLAGSGHVFGSGSDCEVLVHGYEQWGIDGLLPRLRGMFAFAVYDSRSRVCYAVRDRLGIKPLYYAEIGDGRWAFASEVKALMQCGLVPEENDPGGLAGFLLFGSVPQPFTIQKHVRCLEAGSYVAFSPEGMRRARYWAAGSAHWTGEGTAGILKTVIDQHLISDAPLGIFLSSGVDSVGLLALARRAGVRPRTLTVTFDEAAFNEDTAEIARHFDAEHSDVRVTVQDFMEEIPRALAAQDQPASDGLNTYFVARAAHQSGLKAALSGLGGDEVFHGYRHHGWLARHRNRLNAFARLPGGVRRTMASAAAGLGERRGNQSWARLRGAASGTQASLYLAMRGFFDPETTGRLTGRSTRDIEAQYESFEPAGTEAEFADSTAFQLTEMRRYLHDQLLRDADVFGMAWSLEIRVPFLDHELIENALRAAAGDRFRSGVNKPLLVDAIGDEKVLAAARRRKSGFVFPLDRWMRRHSNELRDRALHADLERTEVARLWSAFEQGRMNAVRAWALVVMGSHGSRGAS